MYPPNLGAPEHVRQIKTIIKEEIDSEKVSKNFRHSLEK